ncbi:MAG TPA: hypothetical protein VNF74_10880 [Terriglobales bacterium]|nr:hypothetical protein [Terriglobales bacterium]
MLQSVRDSLKRNHYDPTLHGINLKARYGEYQAELEPAPTLRAAYRLAPAPARLRPRPTDQLLHQPGGAERQALQAALDHRRQGVCLEAAEFRI